MRKAGFSAVEVIIVFLVVGIVVALGVVGYDRWKQTQTTTKPNGTSQQSAASAPEIKQTSDLDKAADTIDQVDFGDSDVTDLDTQSSSF